ncbi:hypothetical protein ACVIGB_008530 [Bradyrhizobium sp. USDA 4341]
MSVFQQRSQSTIFKMSRSMRSRSFSRCKRVISAALSADGSAACVVGCRSLPSVQPGPSLLEPPPQHGIAWAKLLGNDPIERPADATRSSAWRL